MNALLSVNSVAAGAKKTFGPSGPSDGSDTGAFGKLVDATIGSPDGAAVGTASDETHRTVPSARFAITPFLTGEATVDETSVGANTVANIEEAAENTASLNDQIAVAQTDQPKVAASDDAIVPTDEIASKVARPNGQDKGDKKTEFHPTENLKTPSDLAARRAALLQSAAKLPVQAADDIVATADTSETEEPDSEAEAFKVKKPDQNDVAAKPASQNTLPASQPVVAVQPVANREQTPRHKQDDAQTISVETEALAQRGEQPDQSLAATESRQANDNLAQGKSFTGGAAHVVEQANNAATGHPDSFATAIDKASTSHAGATSQDQVRAHPAHVAQDLSIAIARHSKAGEENFSIKLNPEHLGEVRIELSFGEDRKLTGQMIADHRVAAELLRGHSTEITRTLTDMGFDMAGEGFRFHHGSQQQQQGDQSGNNQNFASTESHSSDAIADELMEQAAATPVALGGNQLNLIA